MKRLACILVLLLCAVSGEGDHEGDHHEGHNETDHHEEGHHEGHNETDHHEEGDHHEGHNETDHHEGEQEGDHGHDGHGHDDHHHHEGEYDYEWAGTFDVSSHGILTWTAQASEDGTYPDATMKMVMIQGNSNFSLGSGSVRTHGGEGMAEDNEPCTDVTVGLTIPISTGDPPACYNLVFDESMHTSVFKIDTTVGSSDGITTERIPKVNSIAIFAQHFPIEFERDVHYFKGVDGSDVEPVDEFPEPKSETHSKRWGAAIGASLLVQVCTLIGVFFIAPVFVRLRTEREILVTTLSSAFAAGALVAAAFFLMLYEATHLIAITDTRTESQASAWWGSAVLLGVLTPFLLDSGIAAIQGIGAVEAVAANEVKKVTCDTEGVVDAVAVDADAEAAKGRLQRNRVLLGVLIGDFLHNLVDGFFIGAAFSNCSSTVGWTITAATIYHELAQEISDFLVLTNPTQGGLKQGLALAVNFLSGTSVFIGVCVMLAGEPGSFSTGVVLAYGAGVYLQIALTECMPRMQEIGTLSVRAGALLFFLIGAIAIGLVLLDHEHCAAGGGEDGGHAGHAH
eukprot:Hpha_TRINITY_DN16044_c0_g1::TRINITY_DN16044_c0_g1_i3::g.120138::m.120138/K14718/SLC39A12, ZIP12; solute carrier family 39 (zinc transporter), member 12